MSLETWARNETTRYPYIVIENKPPIWGWRINVYTKGTP